MPSFRTTSYFYSLGLVVTDEQHRFGVRQLRPWPGRAGTPCLIHDGYAHSDAHLVVVWGSRRRPSVNCRRDEMVKTYAVGEALRRRVYTFAGQAHGSGTAVLRRLSSGGSVGVC